MHVECTHHVDASEPDEAGMYSYYYEYDLYRFTDESACVVARSYTDEADEAHFLRIEVGGQRRPIVGSDFAHPLFPAAQAYLRSIGKVSLRWLGSKGQGFEAVPLGRGHSG